VSSKTEPWQVKKQEKGNEKSQPLLLVLGYKQVIRFGSSYLLAFFKGFWPALGVRCSKNKTYK